MFFTMESARLPCWTTFSRLSFSRAVNSSTSLRIFSPSAADLSKSFSSSVLDLVRNAGCKLAERRKLALHYQSLLSCLELLKRRFRLSLGLRELSLPLLLLRDVCVNADVRAVPHPHPLAPVLSDRFHKRPSRHFWENNGMDKSPADSAGQPTQ
jgi:hypothetical protein